jgi:hypothetical protein
MLWPTGLFSGNIPTLLKKLIFRGGVDAEKKWEV